MKKKLELKKSTGGQSLVEFALILPILLLLILGMIEFGWILNRQITLTNAAREGARAAAVQDVTNAYSAADSAVANFATASGLNIDTTKISFSILGSSGKFETGNTIIVTVPAKIDPITNFFNEIIDSDKNGYVDLTATAKMRIE